MAKKATSKKAAAVAPAAAAAAPAPAYYGSSVIRIKTNAKPKRAGRTKSANSVNHRGKTGRGSSATAQDPIQFPE